MFFFYRINFSINNNKIFFTSNAFRFDFRVYSNSQQFPLAPYLCKTKDLMATDEFRRHKPLLDISPATMFNRFNIGLYETFQIAVNFNSLLSKSAKKIFIEKWLEKSSTQYNDRVTLASIRKVIQQYPTKYILLTESCYLSDISFENFSRSKDFKFLVGQKKEVLFLFESYNIYKLQFLLNNFYILENFYIQNFNCYLKNFDKIQNSYMQIANYFAGTTFFLVHLKKKLFDLISELNQKNKRNKHICFLNSTFFLLQANKKVNFRNFISILLKEKKISNSKTCFSYIDLPLDLLAYLTSDMYKAFCYKEDLLDIFYQFLILNKIINKLPLMEKPTICLDNFGWLMTYKDKIFEQWVNDYGVSKEFIIYCFEHFFKGKSFDFQPIKSLFIIEFDNNKIRKPTITSMLFCLKRDLYPFMSSFRYRDCDFVKLQNESIKYGISLSHLCNLNTAAPYGLLYPTDIEDASNLLFQGLLKENIKLPFKFPSSAYLSQLGFPLLEQHKLWNFNNLLLLIQKQIQIAFFDALLELFPNIISNIVHITTNEKKICYNCFFSNRNHNLIFLPNSKVIEKKVALNEVFLYLNKRVKEKTGYNLSFQEYNLGLERDIFEKNVFNNVNLKTSDEYILNENYHLLNKNNLKDDKLNDTIFNTNIDK